MAKKLPLAIFLLAIFSLPFANLPLISFPNSYLQLTDLFVLLAAIGLLVSAMLGGRSIRPGRIYSLISLYILAVSVSAFFSVDPARSAVKLLGITYLGCVAFLTYNLVPGLKDARAVVLAWLAASAVASAYAVLVLVFFYLDRTNPFVSFGLFHYGTLPVGNYPRIQSTFANANMFCHYLSISWMLLLAARRLMWITQSLFYVLGALFLVAAALTLSPGIGALFLGTGIWFYASDGSRSASFRKTVLVLGVAASALFVFATMVKVGQDLQISNQPSARVLTWSSAAETFLANPVTGRGVGTNAADVRYERQHLTDAHNLYLNVAAESGVPAIAFILLFAGWLLLRIRRRFDDPQFGPLALAAAIGFAIAFFYQGMTGSFEDARHLWVLAGFAAGISEERTTDPDSQDLSSGAVAGSYANEG